MYSSRKKTAVLAGISRAGQVEAKVADISRSGKSNRGSMGEMFMTPRNFQSDAWEIARRYGAPGDVAVAKKAMEHGYQLGILDATKLLAEAVDKISEEKTRSNRPR